MEKPMLTKNFLVAAAVCSVLVALLHVYVIAQGPWAYRFFGAGEELAGLAEQGSWIPTLLTSGITLVFFVFAAYYFAGAGMLPKPPLFRMGIIAIAAIYTLRGGLLIPGFIFGMKLSNFDVWSSLVSLAIGLLHCAAVWSYLGTSTLAEARG
jgi:hypothetical protein